MVDNRSISPVSGYFKAGDANSMANKMSEEKMGQGGEYFAQDMQEEQEQQENHYQDRSAQLRASLNGLAMANAGSVMLMKTLKEREKNRLNSKEKTNKEEKENNSDLEENKEEVVD